MESVRKGIEGLEKVQDECLSYLACGELLKSDEEEKIENHLLGFEGLKDKAYDHWEAAKALKRKCKAFVDGQ